MKRRGPTERPAEPPSWCLIQSEWAVREGLPVYQLDEDVYTDQDYLEQHGRWLEVQRQWCADNGWTPLDLFRYRYDHRRRRFAS